MTGRALRAAPKKDCKTMLHSSKPILAAVCLLLGAGVADAAPAGPDAKAQVAAGERLAREACAACHQVSPQQPMPPPVYDPDQRTGIPAPSFLAIARDRTKDASYLQARIANPHYPMKEQVIDDSDVEALAAYIGSLRRRAERR